MRPLSFAVLVGGMLIVPVLGQTSCKPVSESRKKALLVYVREKFKLPGSALISLANDIPVEQTCFHELDFEGKTTIKKFQLKLYLSPDERYLTSDLFDTRLDPVEEDRRKSVALMTGLSENKGSSFGPDHAPVTIVEFSDFQCPYCRRFAEMLEQLSPAEKAKIRVIFHHLPLSVHSWARAAAVGAACAQLQSSKAFWSLHDQLFQEQDQITDKNVKDKLMQFGRTTNSVNIALFRSCLDDELSLGLVFRDMNLATADDIHATPTLFINGRRLQGVKDISGLRQLIAEAAKKGS